MSARGVRLNRALVLESRSTVSDGAGGTQATWSALGTLWAAIDARSGAERRESGQTLSSTRLRITVRAAPVGSAQRPRPDQRFREGARLFQIRAVAEADADGRYLTCYCDEEVAA
ncbi:MAG: phage head closure protein [Marinibacterium sp.]|nr:phage head closure protein [Marinibacterium sp.]